MKNHDEGLKKISPHELGSRCYACVEWQQEANNTFVYLSPQDKALIHGHMIKYVSLAMGKSPSLKEANDIVCQISGILQVANPFETFCTRRTWDKYLGYRHVANLSFLPMIDKHFPLNQFYKEGLEKVFDPLIYLRQQRLLEYTKELNEKKQQANFSFILPNISKRIFVQQLEETKNLIEQAESTLRLSSRIFSPYFMDLNTPEDQVSGMFNALVNSWFIIF